MSARTRQSVVAFLLALGIAVLVSGCGLGGSGSSNSSTPSTLAQSAVAPPAQSVGAAVQDLLMTKLATTQDTPEAFVQAVGQARPVAILFYIPGSVDDNKVLDVYKSVQADFPDWTFLTYDYKNPDAYGDLSLLLQVNYPPEIVLIDKAGQVSHIGNGYVDEGTLKQLLINIGQG